MEETRPNPNQLLNRIAAQESRQKRGRLKIFFGYAAGVGKTCAMLEAAHAAKSTGVDVVAGYIEPHQRPETIARLEGLETLPVLELEYRGVKLREFDLDGALRRAPQLILVDELAHTNAQGCRHAKRYDDVEELLGNGIDVYTTMNVQHLESLNDIIASITQVVVRERVPDQVFDHASQVELVDIEPEELLKRLSQGKIYRPEQARRAQGNFFTLENLVALREIALRRTADRVNREVENQKAESGKSGFFTGEHILCCLSSSPSNAKVIRTAARLAGAFHAGFTALFVERPNTRELEGDNRKRLRENLKLAEQLGARIATVYGDDVPEQIAAYADASGISKIVMGRSNNKRSLLFAKPSFVERLTALAPNLDIYIIPESRAPYRKETPGHAGTKTPVLRWADVGKLAAVMAACTLLGLCFLRSGFSEANIITVYILGVLLVSNLTGSRLFGLTASLVSVLAFNFFFTVPRFTFNATGAEYPITFAVMFLSSLITSTLTMRVKSQAKAAAVKAHRTEVLLETSQRLLRAADAQEIEREVCGQVIRLLDKPVVFYAANENGLTKPSTYCPQGHAPLADVYTGEEEYAVAAWVQKNRKPAGMSTDTLPCAHAFYLPVHNRKTAFAVLGVVLEKGEQVEPFERSLLMAIAGETALALEKQDTTEYDKSIKK